MTIRENSDTMVRAILFEGQAYAVAISAKRTVQKAKDIHGLSKTTAAAVGRLMMAALFCASDIKDENGDATVSFNGGGPVGRVVAVASPKGAVRAAVDVPGADLPIRNDGKLDVAGVLGVDGKLTVIKDNGGDPYIGQVRILSGEVAEDLAYYFAMSEQRPCLIFLGVVIDRDQSVKSAGGLAVFPLPDCQSHVLNALEERIGLANQLSSMLSQELTVDDCLGTIFEGMNMKITDEKPISYDCPCSRERMEKALISMGKKELMKLIEEDGEAELTCHFCQKRYRFDEPVLRVLYHCARQ